MKREYRVAFTEVNEIFKLMPNELLEKIPTQFKDIIMTECAKDYYPNIKEPLEQVNLKKETLLLLGLIYRDFLCEPEEKARLQKIEEEKLKQLKKEVFINNTKAEEKINYSDILKNINEDKKSSDDNLNKVKETSLTVQEKKWYQKIGDLVKGIFK